MNDKDGATGQHPSIRSGEADCDAASWWSCYISENGSFSRNSSSNLVSTLEDGHRVLETHGDDRYERARIDRISNTLAEIVRRREVALSKNRIINGLTGKQDGHVESSYPPRVLKEPDRSTASRKYEQRTTNWDHETMAYFSIMEWTTGRAEQDLLLSDYLLDNDTHLKQEDAECSSEGEDSIKVHKRRLRRSS